MPAQLGKSLFAGNVRPPPPGRTPSDERGRYPTPLDYPSTEGVAVANKTKKETFIMMIELQAGLGLAFCRDEASSYCSVDVVLEETNKLRWSEHRNGRRFDIPLSWWCLAGNDAQPFSHASSLSMDEMNGPSNAWNSISYPHHVRPLLLESRGRVRPIEMAHRKGC